MKVTMFNQTKEVPQGTRLIDLLEENEKKKYICANVNNRLRELDYIVSEDSEVVFLDKTNSDAMLIYQNSIRYLFAMAVNRLYKKVKVVFNNSVSRAIFANISGINGPVNIKELTKIENEMRELI